jgi:hypothetical protein
MKLSIPGLIVIRRAPALKVCPDCREAVPAKANYCPACGHPTTEPTPLRYATGKISSTLGVTIALMGLWFCLTGPGVGGWIILTGLAIYGASYLL